MAFPTPDVDTLRRWRLGEQLSDLTINNTNMPASRLYTGFVEEIEGDNFALFDTSPGSGDSQRWEVGVPGPFGARAMAFYRGTDPQTRDYLVGSNSPEPASEMSLWALIQPYSFLSPAQTIIHKERSPTVWADPTYSAQLFIGTVGEWGTRITVGGVDKLLIVGSGDNNNHLKLRQNLWNLIAMTHDGSVLRTYINGFVGPTLAAVGVIDWGTSGKWVLGGSRAIETAALDAMNAAVQEVWIEQAARSETYFFDAYMALVAEGGTGPPVVATTATAVDSTHVDVVFDTSMTMTGEFIRTANYQVRGVSLSDLIVSAAVAVDSVTVRLTVSEMKNGGTYQLLSSNLVNAAADQVSTSMDEFTGIGEAPLVELISPIDGSEDVPRPTDILFGFNDVVSSVNRDSIQIAIEGEDAVVDGVIMPAFAGSRSYVELQPDGSLRVNLDPVEEFIFGQNVNIVVTVEDAAGNSTAGGGEGG